MLCFSACGGIYSTPNGILTSPFYPNNYPGNRECIYVISQAPGTFVNLNFLNFDIEGSYNCIYDFLEIREYSFSRVSIFISSFISLLPMW